jgi:GDP-4-dehydro-6-deoxy-D-mannose reductase
MRAFVTGGRGFVGGWLRAHLEEQGDEVLAPDVDVTDAEGVRKAMVEAEPDAVYHLAGIASVAQSWQEPMETFRVNAGGTLAVLEGARAVADERRVTPRVLIVASAEVYGKATPDQLPLTEDCDLRPATPYAASKVAAEFVGLQAFLGYGLPVLRVRAFNHVGPGQGPDFVVSGIARQVVEVEQGKRDVVRVGNLTVRRDFTDVRDVVRSYHLLVERGEPGQVYNVCSGRDLAVSELIERTLAISGVEARVETDPDLLRPVDVPVLRGDPTRLRATTGWEPAFTLDETLTDVLAWWRRVGPDGAAG